MLLLIFGELVSWFSIKGFSQGQALGKLSTRKDNFTHQF